MLLNTAVLDIRSADFAFVKKLVDAGGLARCATEDLPYYTQSDIEGYLKQGRCTAGGPGNTAPLLARAGLKVAVGVILGKGRYDGFDIQGRTFYDTLVNNGVDMSATKTHPILPTGTTFIHETPDGERGGLAYFPNANNDFIFKHFQRDVERIAPKVVYYMYVGLSGRGDANRGRDLAAFMKWCREKGALTIADSHTLTGNPGALIAKGKGVPTYKNLRPLLAELDIFFTSVDEARMIRNTLEGKKTDRGEDVQASIDGFLGFAKTQYMMKSGRPQLFGVTVKNGAYICWNGGDIHFVESKFMDGGVVDLVGAGDSFRAGVAGYVARNADAFRAGTLDADEAVQVGNLTATLFVTAPLDNRYGQILPMEELIKKAKAKKPRARKAKAGK